MRRLLALLAVVLLSPSLVALDLGDKAPPLAGIVWLQGGPVALGTKPVLVDFWATDHPPSAEVGPWLGALAKRLDGRVAVASITTEDASAVRAWLREWGDRRPVPVGQCEPAQLIPWRGDDDRRPWAILVSTDGVVLWQGHPYDAERVVTAVLAGRWDLALAKRQAAGQRTLSDLLGREIRSSADEQQLADEVLVATAEVLALDPTQVETISLRLGLARHLGREDLVRATLGAIPLDQLSAPRAEALARESATDEDLRFRELDLALALADRAVKAEPERAEAHAARATVLAAIGLLEQAVAEADEATRLAPTDLRLAGEAEHYRRTAELARHLQAGGLLAAAPWSPIRTLTSRGDPDSTTPPATTPVPATGP